MKRVVILAALMGMPAYPALFARGGARVVFSGHEHNFQHSHHQGIDYFVTGAGSKVRKGAPDRFEEAHTQSWSDNAHFLLSPSTATRCACVPLASSSTGCRSTFLAIRPPAPPPRARS